MVKEKITIEGMSCNHCVMALKKELTLNNINVLNAAIGSAEIEYDEKKIDQAMINGTVSEAGYKLVKFEIVN